MNEASKAELVVEMEKEGHAEEEKTMLPAQDSDASGLSPLVQAAMSGQLDTEKLKQLLDIQKDYEKNEAEKAFYKALAEFKKNEIVLEKDKLVSFEMSAGGTKQYRHTTLGYALQIINPLLSAVQLSLTWETNQDMENGGLITVTCVLSHALGFSKKTSLSASADASGNKNNIQAIGSTISYLERYTAFSLTGVASMDQDDDGNAADKTPRITDEQALQVKAKITDNELNIERFLKWLKQSIKADSIKDIAVTALPAVLQQIDQSIAAKEKKNDNS